MRRKFEATDATGQLHKRSSISHIYSYCVVIHFAPHPPSKRWPEGISACSHAAEWVGSCALAGAKPPGARNLCRGHRNPRGEASVIPFPKVKSHQLASPFNCEA